MPKSKRIKFFDLPFYEELFYLGEAMECAFNPKMKDFQREWIGEIFKHSKPKTAEEIENFRKTHQKELENSPILNELLNMYVKASYSSTIEEFKYLYLQFKDTQNRFPFEENKDAYFDVGCILDTNFFEKGSIFVSYPIFLYPTYEKHGGDDLDQRGGRLFPVHKLTKKEIQEIYQSHPELFYNNKLQTIYKTIAGAQPGDDNN